MSHPYTRSERRHQRERAIARRKYIQQHIWNTQSFQSQFLEQVINPCIDINYLIYQLNDNQYLDNINEWEIQWGRYAKWNFTCDCSMCKINQWEQRKTCKKERTKNKRLEKNWWVEIDDEGLANC